MLTVDEIRELKEYYEKELYYKVRSEQTIDQSYRDDTFVVPEILAPHRALRSGIGARIVDAPAEQIITSNPQVFIHPFKDRDKNKSERISEEVNKWFRILSRKSPNPFKEDIKNLLGRGESYKQVVHNQGWVTGKKIRTGLPVHFIVPDSMVIYGSPEEDDNGVPNRVIVFYQRQPRDVIAGYEDFKLADKNTKRIEWVEYWDSDSRYFEADNKGVLGPQENIYGFTPFVRRYSGLGKRSPEGFLEELIVSEIRFSRGLIHERTLLASDISSVIHLNAHRPLNLMIPQGSAEFDAGKLRDSIQMGAYDVNVFEVPEGAKFDPYDVKMPEREVFQHLANVDNQIYQRSPFLMAGFAAGSSGRQDDLASLAAMKRYDTIVENSETSWATAVEMALKICNIVPTLRPDGINKGDLDIEYEAEVKLKASDPLEADRKATLGDRLWNQGAGAIDLKTHLVDFLGYTEEKADDIITQILVDKITIYNPEVSNVMGMIAAEETGMTKMLEEAQQRQMMQEQEKKMGASPQRRQGEVNTGIGREMIDMSLSNKGARQPPMRT